MKKEFKNMPLAKIVSGTTSISSDYPATATSQSVSISMGSANASLLTAAPSLSKTVGGVSGSRSGYYEQYETKYCVSTTGTGISYFVVEVKFDFFEKPEIKDAESIAKLELQEFLRYSHVQFLIY